MNSFQDFARAISEACPCPKKTQLIGTGAVCNSWIPSRNVELQQLVVEPPPKPAVGLPVLQGPIESMTLDGQPKQIAPLQMSSSGQIVPCYGEMQYFMDQNCTIPIGKEE
ncbi:uncharacterized protein LOC129751055 [Uranotaenia lowii]|uniref:uncharacterized protein LOC129751055 n=1 Tax=Uranotaenia lowii TaxID=190385 RepID=UPI00247A9C19|nr:uncharacterized protein LOC129751055 [Uranotaenia lowii]